MKSRKCDALSPICSSPLLGIHNINQHGIVMEMNSSFELGDTLLLGFHLPRPYSSHQNSALASPSRHKSGKLRHGRKRHFISLEVIVIESKIGNRASGEPICLVTALFSQINRPVLQQLLHYSQKHSYQPSPSESVAARDARSSHQSLLRMVSENIYLN